MVLQPILAGKEVSFDRSAAAWDSNDPNYHYRQHAQRMEVFLPLHHREMIPSWKTMARQRRSWSNEKTIEDTDLSDSTPPRTDSLEPDPVIGNGNKTLRRKKGGRRERPKMSAEEKQRQKGARCRETTKSVERILCHSYVLVSWDNFAMLWKARKKHNNVLGEKRWASSVSSYSICGLCWILDLRLYSGCMRHATCSTQS